MQKFKLNRKQIFFLSFYFGFVVMIAILPLQIKKLVLLNKGVKELEEKINQFETDNASRDNFVQKKTLALAEIEKLEKTILTTDKIFTVSAYVSAKAKEFHVEVQETMPGKPKDYKDTPDGKFKQLPVSLEAKANYHNLAKFLNSLENGKYFLEVESLVLREDMPKHAVTIRFNMLLKGENE